MRSLALEFPGFPGDSLVHMRNHFRLSGLFGLFRLDHLGGLDGLDHLRGILGGPLSLRVMCWRNGMMECWRNGIMGIKTGKNGVME